MKSFPPHPSIQVISALANAEACRAASGTIEPIHLFLTFLKVIDNAFQKDAEVVGLTSTALAELQVVATESRDLLQLSDDDITRLRRTVQKSLGPRGDGPSHIHSLEWSQSSRALFDSAILFVLEEAVPVVRPAHLVRALVQSPPPDVAVFLPQRESNKPALEWETRVNEFVEQFHLTRVTLVLTDMEGSMSIKRRYGDRESAKIFRAHDNLFRETLGKTPEGRELKTIGDAFLLAFSTEVAAVRFCLVIQSGLRTHRDLSKLPLRVRMGIFAGDLLARVEAGSGLSDRVFGITIDTTSRISSLADGGQILTDRGVYAAAHELLSAQPPEGLGLVEWRSHGLYSLKGLDKPVEVFEVGEAGQAAFGKPEASEKAQPAQTLTKAAPSQAPNPVAFQGELGTPMGRDLTALARAGRLTPVSGRRAEMKAMARYLQRTSKRNVLLVGDPGVGKTAIVEGLAHLMAAADAPDFLKPLRIVQIQVADLVSGTKHRGDLELRLKRILSEAASDPNLVLFFDEIHLVMGAGAGEGGLDVANMLKPALARDDVRCIGATTTEEFERHLKGDGALLRRFQLLRVAEPSEEDAVVVCREWARRIEQIQQVTFDDDGIRAAVALSRRLIPSKRLPDKAIDLLENAAVAAKISSLSVKNIAFTKELPRIGRSEIVSAIEEQYGVSVSAAEALDVEKALLRLATDLLGQREAVAVLGQTLIGLRSRAEGSARPFGVLLFTGPTGVGKTLAAEALARALFGSDGRHLARFNMSEYSERHELGRLVGAPPGFIGHENPGALYRFTEGHPQGLILLDEMEKAAGPVHDYFLQVFDKGEATDSRGRTVDFRQYLFVMTCNVLAEGRGIGFGVGDLESGPSSTQLDDALSRIFRREFLARVDRVVRFRAFGPEDYNELLERRVSELATELTERSGVGLKVSADARERLLALCSAQDEGARGFLKLFERTLLGPLWERVPRLSSGTVVRIGWRDGFVFS